MEQKDVWQEMRKHVAGMADAVDKAVRKVPKIIKGDYPPVNIYATEDELIVCAEVPGVAKETLAVSLKGGALLIQGKEDRSEYESYTLASRERGPGEFSREIRLPEPIDEDAEPAASVENGLLTVRLKKKPPAEGKAVHVGIR